MAAEMASAMNGCAVDEKLAPIVMATGSDGERQRQRIERARLGGRGSRVGLGRLLPRRIALVQTPPRAACCQEAPAICTTATVTPKKSSTLSPKKIAASSRKNPMIATWRARTDRVASSGSAASARKNGALPTGLTMGMSAA